MNPIVYPAVEDNAARLRFFLSSTHTEEELRFTATAVAEELAKIRRGDQPSASESAALPPAGWHYPLDSGKYP